MLTRVTIYHNTNDRDRHFGYEPGHGLVQVFTYEVGGVEQISIADRAFQFTNIDPGQLAGVAKALAQRYRAGCHRPLSIGDALRIGSDWLAVGRGAAFDPIDPPAVDAAAAPLMAAVVITLGRPSVRWPIAQIMDGDLVHMSDQLGQVRIDSVRTPDGYPAVRTVCLAERDEIPELTLPADAEYRVIEAFRDVLVACRCCGRSCHYVGDLAISTTPTTTICTECDAEIATAARAEAEAR